MIRMKHVRQLEMQGCFSCKCPRLPKPAVDDDVMNLKVGGNGVVSRHQLHITESKNTWVSAKAFGSVK